MPWNTDGQDKCLWSAVIQAAKGQNRACAVVEAMIIAAFVSET
jgi:hypothetical protein